MVAVTATKDGMIYKVLVWYGYPSYELEHFGVSLCKTFWTIVLLVPLFLFGRGFRWLVQTWWDKWISPFAFEELPISTPPSHVVYKGAGVWARLVTVLIPVAAVVWGGVALFSSGKGYAFWYLLWRLVVAYVVGSVLVVLGVLLVLAVVSLINKFVRSHGGSELVQLIQVGFSSAKNKACPTIRFIPDVRSKSKGWEE